MTNMKIFLDDKRETPDGFIRCYWPEEVIALLETANLTNHIVECVSLDHDLGCTQTPERTGYDVLVYIEKMIHENPRWKMPKVIRVHSANPVARERMRAALESIMDYSCEATSDFDWVIG